MVRSTFDPQFAFVTPIVYCVYKNKPATRFGIGYGSRNSGLRVRQDSSAQATISSAELARAFADVCVGRVRMQESMPWISIPISIGGA